MIRSMTYLLVWMVSLWGLAAMGQSIDVTARTWTDVTGKFTLEAVFVRLEDQDVVLKKPDGSVIRVPLRRLSARDRELARSSAAPAKQAVANQGAKPPADLRQSITVSKREPDGVIFFSKNDQQQPIFATLEFQGKTIVDAVQYGRFHFDRISDDQGRKLKLLKPVEGRFNEDLEKGMAELDHFFLERPGLLKIHFVLEKPPASAKHLVIHGTFQLEVRETITIDRILTRLNKPLAAPGLENLGKFTASLPRPNEAKAGKALALDFVGDRSMIDDIELLHPDGYKISTGGNGEGSRRHARYVRWTAGDPLPRDTKLRIVLAGEPKRISIPIRFDKIRLDGRTTPRDDLKPQTKSP